MVALAGRRGSVLRPIRSDRCGCCRFHLPGGCTRQTAVPGSGSNSFYGVPGKLYCNGGDRSQEDKIRESKVCKDLNIDLKFEIGGIHKLESSSSLTKNHLSEIETRPWGNFHIIARGSGYQIKEINITPGKKQSLQRHKHRSEYWQIVSGQGMVYLEDTKFKLEENDNIFIPKGDIHRLENIGKKTLTLIEIQLGEEIYEEDIERLEDDFGRL